MDFFEPEWLELFTVLGAHDASVTVQCKACMFSHQDMDCLDLLAFWKEAKSWAYIHLEECGK